MRRNDRPWELRDPAATLTTILEMSGATLGHTAVGRVMTTTQEVVGTTLLTSPTPPIREDWTEAGYRARDALSTRLRGVAEELGAARLPKHDGPGWEAPDGVLVTVVCRSGRVVTTAAEMQWVRGWRYANHITNSFSGEVYVVTPHGWAAAYGHEFGVTPRVTDHRQPLLRVV